VKLTHRPMSFHHRLTFRRRKWREENRNAVQRIILLMATDKEYFASIGIPKALGIVNLGTRRPRPTSSGYMYIVRFCSRRKWHVFIKTAFW